MDRSSAESTARRTTRRRSYYGRTVRRFLRHRLGVGSAAFLCILVLAAVFAPHISPFNPNEINTDRIRQAPSSEYWLGTDELGRDILSRIIYGTRISLFVMVGSVSTALVIGTLLGLISGYLGGPVDAVIMRIMDALLAFPGLILSLSIIAALGPGMSKAVIAISIVNIPGFARVVRAQVLSARELEYVKAARSIGCSGMHVLFNEVAPNALDAVVIYASLRSAGAITVESSLSFLGLGVQPPTPSWGWMVAMGMKYWNAGWWMSFFPGLAILLTVLSANLVGDALRDSFDVQLRT